MLYDDARLLDSVCYDLVLGDYPRGKNRAMINALANGDPPYTEQEVQQNNIEVNVNDLTHTCKMHDGRTQFQNALLKTGNNFTARTDMPPVHRRNEVSTVVTEEIGKTMRKSIRYFERQRAKCGNIVLHGISPGIWRNEEEWCTKPLGVEDVLIPSNTLLGFENLPLFVLRRSFTSMELRKLTREEVREPGWNMSMVERIMEWLDSQLVELRNNNWPDVWAPEKVQERVKENTGYYLGDAVPTIECFDIYGYVEDKRNSGWVRRVILDSWGQPQSFGAGGFRMDRRSPKTLSDGTDLYRAFSKNDFLYTSRGRRVYSSWQHALCFQFADLSAVFPQRYHSIRSLGWLLYATCHVGMRLRCKFWESVFEALMQQFKVSNMDDAQRALKLNLINRGFIDDTMKPIPATERWQVNSNLVELGLGDVEGVINSNSSRFAPPSDYSQNNTEKTRFQVQAELSAVTTLVGAAFNQAYMYEQWEDAEIFRRFMRKDSKDPDVIRTRARILARQVPEKYLVADAWDIERERTMGGGNKALEMTIANWLMEQREKFDPKSQRTILRDATLAVTDNPEKAKELVPEEPIASDSVHDSQLAAGTLLMGLPMAFKEGVNHQEYAASLLGSMNATIQKINQRGGVATPDELSGLQNVSGMTLQGQPIKGGNGAFLHIIALAKDPMAKQITKRLGDILGKNMNMVKAFAQRLQQAMQKQQQQGGQRGPDPKDLAKIQGMQLQAQTKAQIAERSAAARTAQKQIAFELKMAQDRAKHGAELKHAELEHASNLAKLHIETAANVRRNQLNSLEGE